MNVAAYTKQAHRKVKRWGLRCRRGRACQRAAARRQTLRMRVTSQIELAIALPGAQGARGQADLGARGQPDRACQRVARRPGRAWPARSSLPARCQAPSSRDGSQIQARQRVARHPGRASAARFEAASMLPGAHHTNQVDNKHLGLEVVNDKLPYLQENGINHLIKATTV